MTRTTTLLDRRAVRICIRVRVNSGIRGFRYRAARYPHPVDELSAAMYSGNEISVVFEDMICYGHSTAIYNADLKNCYIRDIIF